MSNRQRHTHKQNTDLLTGIHACLLHLIEIQYVMNPDLEQRVQESRLQHLEKENQNGNTAPADRPARYGAARVFTPTEFSSAAEAAGDDSVESGPTDLTQEDFSPV